MFKLDPNPTFAVEVEITEPGGGKRPLKVVFRHKTRSAFREWETQPQEDVEMMLDLVESSPDVPEGMTLKEFMEQLLDKFPAAGMDIYFTYRRELLESRVKN